LATVRRWFEGYDGVTRWWAASRAAEVPRWVASAAAGSLFVLVALVGWLTRDRHDLGPVGFTLALALGLVAALSYLRWGWRWWFQLTLLAVGLAYLALGGPGRARFGYVCVALALALITSSSFSVRMLRTYALVVALVSVALLARIGLDAPGHAKDSGIPEVVTLLDRGGDEIVSNGFSAIDPRQGDVQVSVGIFGWIALVVGLGFLYRQLEISCGRRPIGPVTVDDAEGPGTPPPEVTRQLRDWLARADVAEPSTMPGASTSANIVDIAAADPTKFVGNIAKAVAAVPRILFPTTGIVVSPTYVAQDGQHVLTVTVKDARTKRLRTARTCSAATVDGAVEEAAAFVAQYALTHASTVAPWADAEGDRGDALAWEMRSRSAEGTEREALLEDALAANPGSGILRVALGHEALMRGRQQVALRYYLEARLAYPRYIIARYRLASSLAMAADRVPEMAPADQVALCELVGPLGVPAGTEGRELTAALRAAAHREAVRSQLHASLPWLAWSGLIRPRERQKDVELLFTTDMRRRFRMGIKTARLLILVRGMAADDPQYPRLAARMAHCVQAARRWTPVGAVVLYNAACFHAIRARVLDGDARDAETERAAKLLGELRRTQVLTELTSTWLRMDPDLATVRGDTRVGAVLDAVYADEGRVQARRGGR
jgi:hypothetical protein